MNKYSASSGARKGFALSALVLLLIIPGRLPGEEPRVISLDGPPPPSGKSYAAESSMLYEEPLYLFNEGEFFIDVFFATANADRFEIGDASGGGLGFGYFFHRYIGVMAEGYNIDATDQDLALLGGVVLRLPMDDFCTALYAFAEYGGTFGDDSEPTIQFGGGFDVRLTDHTSFFADWRSIQNRHTSLDNGELFRLGLRFVF
jgi:hypothetical protein